MTKLHVQVCVLGGGPAGASAARRLAMLGHSVVLVEKVAFPRPHIGESLQGGVLPLLEVLQLRREVEHAGFLRISAALIQWASPAQVGETAGAPGFQVDRSQFDEILLNGARGAGVQVFQPAKAIDISTVRGEDYTIVVCDAAVNRIRVDCDFLIDATGRASILCGRKRATGMPSIALYAYFREVGIQGTETRVEAGRSAWFWGAPLPQGLFNATVFLSNGDFKASVVEAGSVDCFYRRLIASSHLLSACLTGTRMGKVQVCDATSASDDMPIRNHVFKCGDAAFSIDPLSSQGVQTAIGSALHVAAVIHTILERPSDAALAREFYLERQKRSVVFHADAAARLYAEAASVYQTNFWMRWSTVQSRPDQGARLRLPTELKLRAFLCVHPGVSFKHVPIIEDSLVKAATAVTMPDLPEPIVFLDGVRLAPLIQMLHGPIRGHAVIELWAALVPPLRGMRILDSVLRQGILRVAEICGTYDD